MHVDQLGFQSVRNLPHDYIPVLQFSSPSAMVKSSYRTVSAPASCTSRPEIELELKLGHVPITLGTLIPETQYIRFFYSYRQTVVAAFFLALSASL